MQLKRIIRKIKSFPSVLNGKGKVSYAQYGEDIILSKLLAKLPLDNITYLDIGANEPIMGSNTYALYSMGYSGVLIEPNPALCKDLKQLRPLDVTLNIGISDSNTTEADYYMFSGEYSALNTFSKADADGCEQQGIPIKQVIKMPLQHINDILSKHFKAAPTFISLDVEGLDEQILKALDWTKYAPLLLCVETVTFSLKGAMEKRQSLMDFMQSAGYFLYADTHVNTLFCHTMQYEKLIENTVN